MDSMDRKTVRKKAIRTARRLDKINRKYLPDKTKRWCMICRKYTYFVYNKIFGHSECEMCGCRMGRSCEPDKILLILEAYENSMDREYRRR
jgi:hypothetical protein